ncbi:DUF3489 domain-containing protein [Sediminimonas qiaohouensis]|uniref:DUF3489 domain-containing protein n=1 Tax=Sediminimonas qiaohouensis TaxID=552061 RepID=UPI0003FC1EC1|nr:DUF3489 domain-containing protein [Sediminimonas qiaohouensis]
MTQSKTNPAKAKNPAKMPAGRTAKPATKPPRKTKTAMVLEMLERSGGASLSDLCKATGWQAHTVRATLSGLRKTGHVINREQDEFGVSVYRITANPEAQ